MTQEPDYVTVETAAQSGFFCVLIMKHDHTHDEYYIYKSSRKLTREPADNLAKSWAAAMGLEIR